jgi:hypothetical protein
MHNVFKRLSQAGLDVAWDVLGGDLRDPDLIIAPDGEPYLYRWFLTRTDGRLGGSFFHVQVRSDPERPLHDHPWDNMSVILSGGYEEVYQTNPPNGGVGVRTLMAGDTVFRRASEAHRLILPPTIPYTMTLFSFGAHRRSWGFWYQQGFVNHNDVCREVDGKSVHIKGGEQWK